MAIKSQKIVGKKSKKKAKLVEKMAKNGKKKSKIVGKKSKNGKIS